MDYAAVGGNGSQVLPPSQHVFARSSTAMKCLIMVIIMLMVFEKVIPPEVLSPALKGIGTMLVLILLNAQWRRLTLPLENKLYFAFLLWAVVTAFIVAVDVSLSMNVAFKVLQMGLLFWAATVAHYLYPDMRLTLYGCWGCGIIFIALIYFDRSVLQFSPQSGGRLSVIGENANFTGQIFLYAIFSALYLGSKAKTWQLRLMTFGSIPVFTVFLMFTGSRKNLVGFAIILALWALVFAPVARSKGTRFFMRLATYLALIGSLLIVLSNWEETSMGRRWEESISARDFSQGRMDLYKDGWDLFARSPIAGVGLQNQTLLMVGEVHSEYLDILCTTGAVGFLLYFSIYCVALRRAWHLRRSKAFLLAHDWHAFLIYMVMIFWLMFGYARFTDPLHLVVFGSFVGVWLHYSEKGAYIRTGQSRSIATRPTRPFAKKAVAP